MEDIKIIADKQDIVAIANKIRTLCSTSDTMSVDDMKLSLSNIGENLNDIAEEQVGLISDIIIALEDKSAPSTTPTGTMEITENGTYNVTDYAFADVNVPSREPVIQQLTVTENGTYEVPQGVNGYSPVVVNVAGSGGASDLGEKLISRTITEYSNIELIKLGDYALAGCASLISVNLPSMTTMGTDGLRNCTSLTDVNFPALLQVPYNGFYRDSALVTADFSSLTKIGSNGFYQCTSLNALIIRTQSVCTVASGTVFTNAPIAKGTGYIYVPSALVDTYKAATNWATYAAQFRALEDYTVDGTITGALDTTKI